MIEAAPVGRVPEAARRLGHSDEFWFPGRWLGGTSMIFEPLLLLAGVVLRAQFYFFFPQQLAAYQDHPRLITTSYCLFAAGNIFMWPAIATLAHLIGRSRPGWALWGGALVMFGLFGRTFHAGADHLAFQIVRVQNLQAATQTISSSYGAFHIASGLTLSILTGWIVLAIGAHQSGVLGLLRSIALGGMSALMIGVLKGSSVVSVLCTSGLCVALVPLGIVVLRTEPAPTSRKLLGWLALLAALIAFSFIIGQLG